MEFERDTRHSREMNLTPLVDIILLLVIFFMLSTSFVVSESMELALPSKEDTPTSSTPPSPHPLLQIQLLPSGEVWVEKQRLTREGMNDLLAQRLSSDPETNITLFTTPGVKVQQLVHVLDDVYLTGGRHVQVDKVAYGN